MFASVGVDFYSYIAAKVIPNTTESVDEVIGPRFFSVYFQLLDHTRT